MNVKEEEKYEDVGIHGSGDGIGRQGKKHTSP
jgi:hypothetical protein